MRQLLSRCLTADDCLAYAREECPSKCQLLSTRFPMGPDFLIYSVAMVRHEWTPTAP